MAIQERFIPDDRIEVLADGSIQIREATVIFRDGERDQSYPPKFHRYVLHPGDALDGRSERIAAIAASVWTPEVIAAFEVAKAAAVAAEEGEPVPTE